MASRYGNIMKVATCGASWGTAKADGKQFSGVLASHKMAENDLPAMKKYKEIIMKVAKTNKVEAAVICGIISRVSRAGTALDQHGRADNGKAFGLMQIDTTPAPKGAGHIPKGEWNSKEHLQQATEILIESIKRFQERFPSWTKEQQLKGGLAAYNTGEDHVESYDDVDANTTGIDFSNDVVARSQWFYKSGFCKESNVGLIVATTAVAAVGAVALAPVALTAMGFAAGGIVTGSIAASMMSTAAVANGGAIAAGSIVAILQSAGAVGLSATATAIVGSVGATVGGALGGAVSWLKNKRS
ncbi:lysozyme g isoform X1 [Esox lucius]|uniref:Lysozyme g n=2 Tax=Esox lucius TaxID=8010 RepID=A0AAY5L0J6_ESOLU|nr:lysozyme g isoform X1 [Esox lucius]